MPGNPLVDQGTLNRLRGSVVIPNYPNLNVTASFLNKAGIRVSPEGVATTFLPTLTGGVTSPEPYQMVSISIALLKTQNLAGQWKAQLESDARLGPITVIPDSSAFPPYQYINCAIENVDPMSFNGEDAGYTLSLKGYYSINNFLFSLV